MGGGKEQGEKCGRRGRGAVAVIAVEFYYVMAK